MKYRNLHIIPITALTALLFLSSCIHKDLDYGSGKVTVQFDWRNAPSATPDGMMVVAFSGKSQPVSFHIPDMKGGEVPVPLGTYNFIAYNDNTEDLNMFGRTWDTYEIAANETELVSFSPMFASRRAAAIPRAPDTQSQTVIFEPDELWAAAVKGVTIEEYGPTAFTMGMVPATMRLHFTINNVENIENLINLTGTISGQAGAYFPANDSVSLPDCIIPFEMEVTSDNTIVGSVRTFRGSTGELGANKLVVYMELTDHSKYYATFDVTEAIGEARRNASYDKDGNITLNIDIPEFSIPEPLYNGNGLHPGVAGWQDVQINVRM